MNQEEIWINHIKHLTPSDVVNEYNNPAVFQKEFCNLIDSYAGTNKRIIEVGCETGVTSFLLSEKFDKSLLDLNPNAIAIALAEASASLLNKKANFYVGDMFKMEFQDETFDLVFNAGVIEHFIKEDRTLALREYARILKNGGAMIIAFPNHHCPPYRFAYLLLRLIGRWPYPTEYKLYNLIEEIKKAGLVLNSRQTLSRGTIFNWLGFAFPIKKLFLFFDRFFKYEGYLTVLVITKENS
jgi:ubiquinone/menaquinone biosynthesis C-methylase UbiE